MTNTDTRRPGDTQGTLRENTHGEGAQGDAQEGHRTYTRGDTQGNTHAKKRETKKGKETMKIRLRISCCTYFWEGCNCD